MKNTYKSPQCKSVSLTSTSLLANSWSEDSRGGIDDKPQEQEEFGVKGNSTDNNAPWYKR